MKRVFRGVELALLVTTGVALGCSGRASQGTMPRSSLIADAPPPPAFRSPATWRYHPSEAAPLFARAELADGRALLAGERGERWLVDEKRGRAEAASRLAPETLVAILRSGTGFLFVGASGGGYEAREPLGPFIRSSAPLDPLVRLSAAGRTILGVRRDGRLARSADAASSWQLTGPSDVLFTDVELGSAGRGLALGVPEQLWETADQGATWKRVDVPPFGALGLERDARAGIVVRGAIDVRRLEGARPFLPLEGEVMRPQHALGAEPPRGPSAGALAEDRAVILAGRYMELVRHKQSDEWRLVSGALDAQLEESRFPEANGCKAVRLAAFDSFRYVACARSPVTSDAQNIEIFRSQDAGRHWEREPYTPRARITELSLAVGAGGSLVVTGICPMHAAGPGCKTAGVHYRRVPEPKAKPGDSKQKAPKGPGSEPKAADAKSKTGAQPERSAATEDTDRSSYELGPAATPALKGVAAALSVSIDGRIVYAVGGRTKGGTLAVFVSHDAGRTFSARDIEQLAAAPADEELDEEPRWGVKGEQGSGDPPAHTVQSVAASEDGSLAIVLRRWGASTLVVTDEEGRVLSVASAPSEGALIGAAGARALAVSPASREVWESLDAGASWDPIGRLPLPLCPSDARCEVPISCHARGCVIGHELSRLGWRGQVDDDPGVLPPPERSGVEFADRKLRTPIACTLDAAAWQRLPGVRALPTANDAAIGKLAWYVLSVDPDHAAATIYQAEGGRKQRVDSVVLLAPVARPESFAFGVAKTQAEGAAVLRYAIPEATPGETQLKNLEIAWVNQVEGRVGRARLADAGAYMPGDYKRGGRRAQRAEVEFFSIASGGVYLRLHPVSRHAQDTLFFDGRSVTSVPPIPWPSFKTADYEMMHVAGTHLPIAILPSAQAIVRARQKGKGWTFDAIATGLPDPSSFELQQTWELAYHDGRAGLHVTWFDPQGSRRSSLFHQLRADGALLDPPLAVATQLDASDRPARCGSTQRSTTPRVLARFQPGTRHPVVVADAVEPLRVLLTDDAVMHGAPDSACISAWEAEPVEMDASVAPNEPLRAILVHDDLEHAWLFRSTQESRGEAAIEWRSMSCRFDPTLEIPAEVFQAPGTQVRRAR